MMSFKTFKKQFDKSLSEKSNRQILSEIEKLGHKLKDREEHIIISRCSVGLLKRYKSPFKRDAVKQPNRLLKYKAIKS